ncbi:MAG TPA: penicillin acylase family protein [Candidatus Binatia bacterium]|nr:penicillin acylase family protein [Candidatus Binatia bacterium]
MANAAVRAARFTGRVLVGAFKLVAVVVSLVIVALAVLGAITTQRGWPQVTGTIAVPGLDHDVTVLRDRYGLVQILADNTHDLFMAQGYVHAQERMWQMEVSRRIGAGRLSELFGAGQVDRDRYIRTLGWRIAAQRDLDAMSPLTKFILQSYADGVNAWIDEHNGKLPTPFVLAGVRSGTYDLGGYRLEPWTPLDTATWQKVQAWSLGGNADSEIFRYLAGARLGDPAITDELFPPYPEDAPVITPTNRIGEGGAVAPTNEESDASDAAAESARAGAEEAGATQSAVPRVSPDHADALVDLAGLSTEIAALAGFDRGAGLLGSHGVGSNNWVVSGEHTASGKPILANDPHLGFSMPSVWFMNGLHCRTITTECPWDVVGVSFPGAPAVILGHNARIAWGATNVNPDTQDLFLEAPDPSDPQGRYLYEGRSEPYELRHEIIKVAGGSTVEFDVRISRHGPILSDVDERLQDGPSLALRWTSIAEVDLTLESFFAINRASSFEEFRAAFANYVSPSQNFLYADVDGNIGYVLPGLIPIREVDPTTVECPGGEPCVMRYGTGNRVRDGQSGDAEWMGYVPRDELPWQLNPANGRIVSANNLPVDAVYPHWLGNEFDPGYRAARVEARLDAIEGKLTTADMRSIQMDDYLGRADRIVPLLISLGVNPSTDDGRTLWGRIASWDRQCDPGSLGCTAYVTVELAVLRAIFDDELGPIARDYVGSVMSWQALIEVLGDPQSRWWTVTGTSEPARSPAELVAKVVDETAAALRAKYGAPESWTWGRLHTVQFQEQTLGTSGIPPIEWYFNTGAVPVGGADGAIQNNYYRVDRAYPDPDDPSDVPPSNVEVFGVTNGPSYRLTVDMGDLDGAQIIITTGQSGNVGDPHYGDLVPLWASGQSIPLPFSPGTVLASAAQTLTLAPAP